MLYFIKYQSKTGIIMQDEFNLFGEYYDRLTQLRNKATNILDYGAFGE